MLIPTTDTLDTTPTTTTCCLPQWGLQLQHLHLHCQLVWPRGPNTISKTSLVTSTMDTPILTLPNMRYTDEIFVTKANINIAGWKYPHWSTGPVLLCWCQWNWAACVLCCWWQWIQSSLRFKTWKYWCIWTWCNCQPYCWSWVSWSTGVKIVLNNNCQNFQWVYLVNKNYSKR